MAVLTLKYKGKSQESFPIGMGDTFIIGREEGNDIVIGNLAVSFHHAKIESIGDEFLLIDLHSENGTFVNEQPIKAHWLVDGDAVSIGKHTLNFSNPQNQGRHSRRISGASRWRPDRSSISRSRSRPRSSRRIRKESSTAT